MLTAKATKTLNGYNVVAHEHVPTRGAYIVLAERTTDYGHEYVTAWVANYELDTEWFWGEYTSDFVEAFITYRRRKEG